MVKASPTISYGHGFCDDCGEWYASSYVETEDGQTLSPIVVTDDDIYDIECTVSQNNKIGFESYPGEGTANNLGLSSTVYTKIRYRYKTSDANVKAKIVLRFSTWDGGLTEAQNIAAGHGQLILDNSSSLTWVAGVQTITTGKTIDHLRLYCNSATGHVYYDFIMIYKNDFTIPNTKYGQSLKCAGRLGVNDPIGAQGDEHQTLGTHSAEVEMDCDLDIGTWTRSGDTLRGQVFLDIVHNSPTEPFQWIDTGDHVAQFKVLLDAPVFENSASEAEASSRLHLLFRELRRSPANGETVDERFGLNL